jgi:hypothetical protein
VSSVGRQYINGPIRTSAGRVNTSEGWEFESLRARSLPEGSRRQPAFADLREPGSEGRINRLLSGPPAAGFGNRLGTKLRATGSNQCDRPQAVTQPTLLSCGFETGSVQPILGSASTFVPNYLPERPENGVNEILSVIRADEGNRSRCAAPEKLQSSSVRSPISGRRLHPIKRSTCRLQRLEEAS